MGLPSLILNADLGATWHRVLEENDLRVSVDDAEMANITPSPSTHVSEVPYRIIDDGTELRVLEASFKNGHRLNGVVALIFMPGKNPAEHRLRLLIQAALLGSGATVKHGDKNLSVFISDLLPDELVASVGVALPAYELKTGSNHTPTYCPSILIVERSRKQESMVRRSIEVIFVRAIDPMTKRLCTCLVVKNPNVLQRVFPGSLRWRFVESLRSLPFLSER